MPLSENSRPNPLMATIRAIANGLLLFLLICSLPALFIVYRDGQGTESQFAGFVGIVALSSGVFTCSMIHYVATKMDSPEFAAKTLKELFKRLDGIGPDIIHVGRSACGKGILVYVTTEGVIPRAEKALTSLVSPYTVLFVVRGE